MCVANRGKSISQHLSSGREPQQTSEPPPDFAFTPDIDRLLRDLHAKHGTRWTVIATEMNANFLGKPILAADCGRRLKILIERDEMARKLTRTVLPGVDTLIALVPGLLSRHLLPKQSKGEAVQNVGTVLIENSQNLVDICGAICPNRLNCT